MPGDVVTGTGIVDQTFDQWYKVAQLDQEWKIAQQNLEVAKAQLAAQIQSAQISAGATVTAAGISAAAQQAIAAAEMEVRKAQIALDLVNADRQYGLDVQQFGLAVASEKWAQTVQKATFELDVQQFGLQKAQFNASQRKAEIDAKLQALELLASKTGPQDWVNYNNLLAGMSSPEALAQGEVSPFGFIEGMNQPYEGGPEPTLGQPPELPGGPPAFDSEQAYKNALNMIAGLGNIGGGGVPGGGSAAAGAAYKLPEIANVLPPAPPAPPGAGQQPGAGAGTSSSQTTSITPNAVAAANWSGVQANNPNLANLQPGQSALVTTGAAGPSKASDYVGYKVFISKPDGSGYEELTGDATINPGAAISLVKQAEGGVTEGENLLVGEEGEEIIQNLGTNPRTGAAKLRVIPNKKTRKILNNKGRAKQMVKAATGGDISLANQQKAYTNLISGQGMQAADPTKYVNAPGSYGNSNPYAFQFATYSPETIGNQPFIQQLQGKMPTREFGAFGASLTNPNLGIKNMPFNVNYRTLMDFLPSTGEQAQSLYNQGLGVDFRDVLESARRAAPIGASFGPTRYAGR